MIDKIVIKPLIGIDGLELGATKAEVLDVLGDPNKCSTKSYKQDKSSEEEWEYFQLGLELTFSSKDNFRLGTIGVISKNATIEGHHLIGLNEKQLLKTLDTIGIGPTLLEDDLTELNSRDYACDKHGLSFWVHDGVVNAIAIFPEYDESGNVSLWPK